MYPLLVGESGRVVDPGATESGSIAVATLGRRKRKSGVVSLPKSRACILEARKLAYSEVVGTGKGNDFLVVESHSVENGTKVVGSLCAVRETPTGRTFGVVYVIGTAWFPVDIGTAHGLHSGHTGKGPEATS
jgi:hypothetical protein